MKKKSKPFEIKKDAKGKFYWIVTAENGEPLARSSESYTRRIDCKKCAELTSDIIWREQRGW